MAGDFVKRAKLYGGITKYVKFHIAHNRYPFVYYGVMKKEYITLQKLKQRKQRMFVVQCKEHVAAHKRYFSKQSKRLRKFREISHGQTWFYGNVNTLAQELIGSEVASEDDTFWDKFIMVMEDVYYIRRYYLERSGELVDDDRYIVDLVIENMRNNIIVLPTGDIIMIRDRNGPSGADATTENNCIIRLMVEIYMQVKYYKHIGRPLDVDEIKKPKRGTRYLGDDRIAKLSSFPEGYSKYYVDNIGKVGIHLKEYAITAGPEGAEFAGFKIARSHWNRDYYVPHYKIEKVYAGLFSKPANDFGVLMTRFMAFALLMYPHYEEFCRIKPHVLSFLRTFDSEEIYNPIMFWADEDFLQRAWTGHEVVGGKRNECLPSQLMNDVLRESSLAL